MVLTTALQVPLRALTFGDPSLVGTTWLIVATMAGGDLVAQVVEEVSRPKIPGTPCRYRPKRRRLKGEGAAAAATATAEGGGEERDGGECEEPTPTGQQDSETTTTATTTAERQTEGRKCEGQPAAADSSISSSSSSNIGWRGKGWVSLIPLDGGRRMAHFCSIGLVLGPIVFAWEAFMEHFFPLESLVNVGLTIALEMLVLNPIQGVTILGLSRGVGRRRLEWRRVEQQIRPALEWGTLLWPALTFGLYLIPEHLQDLWDALTWVADFAFFSALTHQELLDDDEVACGDVGEPPKVDKGGAADADADVVPSQKERIVATTMAAGRPAAIGA